MAFLAGIFNRQQPAAAAAPAQSTGPAVPAVPAASAAGPASQQQAPANPAASPAAMQNAQPSQAAGGPQNPLDAFSDMFKPRPVDPNTAKQPTLADPILAPLDVNAFKQQVATTNFAASIPQDTITKALSGDPAAFAEAINLAAREAFVASAQVTHGLVEHGSRAAAGRVNDSLDSRVRNAQINMQNTTNEALTHPAVAPLVQLAKRQIAQSHPNLTPEAVQQQAEQYFSNMAEVLLAPKQAAAQAAATPKQGDFSYLLSST